MTNTPGGHEAGCRMVACRTSSGTWEFLIVNDGPLAMDGGVLEAVGTEWGDEGRSEATDVAVPALAVGEHAVIWPDDAGDAEFRMDFRVQVRRADRSFRLLFEFPRLYRMRDLPEVPGIGRPGLAVGPSFG